MINSDTIGYPLKHMVLAGNYISAFQARKNVDDLVEKDSNEDPFNFFREIVKEMTFKMSSNDDDTILERYCNELDPDKGKPVLCGKLKALPPLVFGSARAQVAVKYHLNQVCPWIKHVPVL
jgi:hypothetical protein